MFQNELQQKAKALSKIHIQFIQYSKLAQIKAIHHTTFVRHTYLDTQTMRRIFYVKWIVIACVLMYAHNIHTLLTMLDS